MLSLYVAAAARARCISTACESRASTGIFSNIAETAEDVPDLSAALSCLRLTTPDLQLSYPEDADAHFEQLQQALAPWLQSTPHKYAGHSGPWIENVWKFHFENMLLQRSNGTRLHGIFGAYVPLLIPWTDLWVNNGGRYPPGLVDTLLTMLRPAVPYLTIASSDRGITGMAELSMARIPNVLVLSAGGYGHVPVPMFKQAEALAERSPISARSSLVAFAGRLDTWTPQHLLGRKPYAYPETRLDMLRIVADSAMLLNFSVDYRYGQDWRRTLAGACVSLCPRGYGRTSYLLTEVIQLGLLPLHVWSDIPWLPYAGMFETFGFSSSLSDLPKLLKRLHAMTEDELTRREALVLRVRETHFNHGGFLHQFGRFLRGASSDLRCQPLPDSVVGVGRPLQLPGVNLWLPDGAEPADVVASYAERQQMGANQRWALLAAACDAVPCSRFESQKIIDARAASLARVDTGGSVPMRTLPKPAVMQAAKARQRAHYDATCCPGIEPDALWDALQRTAFARQDGLVLVDVGFNLGQWTTKMFRRWPKSTVHAFEAFAPSMKIAREAFEAPGGLLSELPGAQVHWFDIAVSNVSGPVDLHRGLGDGNAGSEHIRLSGMVKLSRAIAQDPAAEMQKVGKSHGTSLDDWAFGKGPSRIDILKLDTEGSEPLILLGAQRVLRELRPPLLFLECHIFWEDLHDPPFSIHWGAEVLEGFGYDLFYVSNGALIPLSGPWYQPIYDVKGWRNCIAVSAEMAGRDSFLRAAGLDSEVVATLLQPDPRRAAAKPLGGDACNSTLEVCAIVEACTAADSAPTVPAMRFSGSQLTELWNSKVRATDDYLRITSADPTVRARDLRTPSPPMPGGFDLGAASTAVMTLLEGDYDFPRALTLMDFVEWIDSLDIRRPRSLLTTNLGDPELVYLDAARITGWVYDGAERGDLHRLHEEALDGEPFDFVLLGQTLEHLYNPLLALTNLRAKMEKGGYLFTSVPSLNIQHLTPLHFQHLTPMGLATLLLQAGFEIIHIGQWGNLQYETQLLSTLWWPSYSTLGPQHVANDRDHPVQVWALVRRPAY